MTDEQRHAGCLDANTMAEYIDGTLEPRQRAEVEAHLAECEECYEVFGETVHAAPETRGGVSERPIAESAPRRRTRWIAFAAAAAVVLTVSGLGWRLLFPSPDQQAAVELAALGKAASNWRPTIGRLTPIGPWTEINSSERSSETSDSPLTVQVSAAKLRLLAEEHPSAKTLAAAGVAELLLKRSEEAASALMEAVRLDPTAIDARVDLTAALLELSAARKSQLDASRALSEGEAAVRLAPDDPRAAFNLALALEASKLTDRAKKAWKRYLELDRDPSSGWAREARAHIAALDARQESALKASRPDTWQLSDLGRLAHDHPGALLRFISKEALPAWGKAALASDTPDVKPALNAVHALSTSGRRPADAYLAEAAARSGTWPKARRHCLAQALISLGDWERMPVRDPRALNTANRIDESLKCAAVDRRAARIRQAQSLFFSGKRTLGLAATADLDLSNEQTAAIVFQMRGLAALVASRMADAQDDLVTSARLAATTGDDVVVVANASYLAEIFDEQGDHEAAWQHVANGLDVVSAADAFGRSEVISTAAIAAAHGGLHGAAFHFADELLAFATDSDARTRLMGHMQRGRALESLNDHAGAVNDLALARADLAALPTQTARTAWQAELDWVDGIVFATADPMRAERSLSAAVAQAERADRRFRLAELLLYRGRSYRRLNRSTEAVADFRRGAAIVDDQRLAIRDEQLRISRTADVWELFGELIESAGSDADALLAAERARARELMNRLTPEDSARPTLASLQLAVPRDGVAIVFAVRPEQLWTWTLTREQLSLAKTNIRRAELTALVTASRRELFNGHAGRSMALLSQTLLGHSRLAGGDQIVVIVPDGPLHDVPFAALEGFGRAPLAQYAVPIVAPSLASFAVASSRARSTPTSALLIGVGSGVTSLSLPTLPGVDREIAALARVYTTHKLLDERTATASAILSALPSYSLVHLATHSQVDSEVPSRTRLFVAPESDRISINADEIARLHLRDGAVVVLAACDSARGRSYAGEGAMSLVRPFLAAGASTVIGALWPVDDAAATEIFVTLHSQMKDGVAPARALAAAQRAAIRSGLAPRFWAGYQATGGLSSLPAKE